MQQMATSWALFLTLLIPDVHPWVWMSVCQAAEWTPVSCQQPQTLTMEKALPKCVSVQYRWSIFLLLHVIHIAFSFIGVYLQWLNRARQVGKKMNWGLCSPTFNNNNVHSSRRAKLSSDRTCITISLQVKSNSLSFLIQLWPELMSGNKH